MSTPPADAAVWRRGRVLAEVGVSEPTLYRWCAAGRFPAPLRLGERARGWLSADVRAWLDERAREAREARGDAPAPHQPAAAGEEPAAGKETGA